MITRFRKWRRKRFLLKLAKQPVPATREQLIKHFEYYMIWSINQETTAQQAMLSVATGVLDIIDPIERA